MTQEFEAVIGLEVHAQINTQSKIFCGCPTTFGAVANTQLCPVCAGYPGVLPVLNKRAVESLVKTGLALGSKINRHSIFARKQYFYPDLPKNYQISQYEQPLAEGGSLEIVLDGTKKTVRLTRIHLEEDAGKLLHAIGSQTLDYSLVDLNRTGVPLMEIVSEPDLTSPEEASAYLSALKTVVLYLGVSSGSMEEGSFRCDANVSVRPKGSKTLGTRAEVKNMNSFKSVRDAIAYEIGRQVQAIQNGERIVQETRLWNADKAVTISMRSKEEAHDYRYFPEPDLVPMELSDDFIENLRKQLPELPWTRAARLQKDFSLSPYDAMVLTAERPLADYFEAVLGSAGGAPVAKTAANWVTTELLGRLNNAGKSIAESPVRPEHLGGLLKLLENNTVSGKIAKTVFQEMFETGQPPESIVKAKGLVQITDETALSKIITDVLAANPKIAADYKAGKTQALGSLVGQVMKATGGKANPQLTQKLLQEKLTA